LVIRQFSVFANPSPRSREAAPIRRRDLGRHVADLGLYEDDIRRALDRLFTGF
jgi:hypothetical protein